MSKIHTNPTNDLDELIRQFIQLAQEMKDKGIITEDQYTDLTANKIKYLNDHS